MRLYCSTELLWLDELNRTINKAENTAKSQTLRPKNPSQNLETQYKCLNILQKPNSLKCDTQYFGTQRLSIVCGCGIFGRTIEVRVKANVTKLPEKKKNLTMQDLLSDHPRVKTNTEPDAVTLRTSRRDI